MLCLNRPMQWWRAGEMHWLTPEGFRPTSEYEAALLLQLNGAGRGAFFIAGDSMDDDYSAALTLVTPPASEPMTLDDAKSFLRIEHNADDAAITRGITAARQYAERYLGMAILPQTWDYAIASPCAAAIALPFGPAQTIVSVTALAADGVTSSAVSAGTYRLSVDGRKVIFSPLPTVAQLTIRFTASIAATPSNVPALLVQGMLHHLAVMMEARDGLAPLPMQSMHCYQPYRRISL